MRLTCLVSLAAGVVVLACNEGPRVVAGFEGESFVAEDAGQIPLTSPGTAPRVEREVIGVPVPPMEYMPTVPEEQPFDDQLSQPVPSDTAARRPPAERQQRATDTMRRSEAADTAVPLVRPPSTPPPPPPTSSAPPSQPRATTPPVGGATGVETQQPRLPSDTPRAPRPQGGTSENGDTDES